MSTLYEDRHVVLDDQGITIKGYYAPILLHKTIPYAEIRRVRTKPLSLWARTRIWGGAPLFAWLHSDILRPFKSTCIVIETDARTAAIVTPSDPETVARILAERTTKS